MEPNIEDYHDHFFKAADLVSKHFFDIKDADLSEYAKQKGELFEALIKLFVDVEKREAICPLNDIKFKVYRSNLQMDEWD